MSCVLPLKKINCKSFQNKLKNYRRHFHRHPEISDKEYKVYGKEIISERHRHRYEVNMTYADTLRRSGMYITGKSPDGKLPEIVEIKDHPWFMAVQFHPELKSKPFDPSPVFVSFVKAAIEKSRLI